eukprot:TRINITY_DN59020_c0_g1_i15.p1 TRINITY_DN59020_c0_g1~~TRINITY_DN59020_c0_g1_i15.p1  ORF type:complete len:221 (-),score=44.98 TRINITY_DN59020_c0_g1_i15:103-765(-)
MAEASQCKEDGTMRHVFLLAGQSNMAGRGPLSELQDEMRDDRIGVLDAAGQWCYPARHPLHYDKPDKVGVGPGLAFAESIIDFLPAEERKIGLLPCAVGGSELERWAPPSDNQKDGGDLFASAVHRVREGLASSPGCRLSGVLWHQGESDSGSADLASTYRQRLVETLRGLATEGGWPDVPVVIGELAVHFLDMQNDARFAFAERVNTAIMAAATDMSPL